MQLLLLRLPVEIRTKIFKQCLKQDLFNFALCSKVWWKELVPLLWKEFIVRWKDLDNEIVDTKTANLKFTRELCFRGLYLGLREKNNGCKYFNFAFILCNCNPNLVTSLTISHHIISDGLKLAAKMLPNLLNLRLDNISDQGSLDFVAKFLKLEQVTLEDCKVTDHHIREICLLSGLKELRLTYYIASHHITGLSFHYIKTSATQLKKLRLNSKELYLGCFNGKITELQNLIQLDLPGCNLGDGFFQSAERNLQGMEVLNISETNISDEILASISRLRNLRRLNISSCYPISDQGLVPLQHLGKLRYLNLSDTSISDEALRGVWKISSLRALNLFYCEELTDNGLLYVSQLRNLLHLNLGCNDHYSDKGFAHLRNLTHLQELEMGNLNVTDASLKTISGLLHLKELDISDCYNLTDDGLLHLSTLKYLKKLGWGDDSEIITEDGLRKAGLSRFLL